MKKVLIGLGTQEIREWCVSLGESAFRGGQIAEWIYHHGVTTFDEMTNLPPSLRAILSNVADVGALPVALRSPSKDGSVKLLLARASNRNGRVRESEGEMIEAVGLPYPDRVSCCVSSQIGCPIGCVFCATGLSGFTGNLTAGEIVAQVLAVQKDLRIASTRQPNHRVASLTVNHVVFMGMGEPLLNYENVVKAVRLLNEELGIGMRHITVSTVGLVPQMRRLAQEKMQITLAVSLHATTSTLREQLVPGTRAYTVEEIIDASRSYVSSTGRRVTFEYVLLHNVNDSAGDARRLAGLLRDIHAHVNLIPFNPVDETDFHTPLPERIRRFRGILESAGITVTQRVQRGADANAACGQLRKTTMKLLKGEREESGKGQIVS